MVKLDFKTRAYARAEAMFHVAKARGTPRSFEDCIPDAMDALAAEERADFARRLAALERVVEAARALRQGERSCATGSGVPMDLAEWHAAQRRVREAGEELDTALAALNESEVGRG